MNDKYSANDIIVLSDLDAIRKNPSMYIGSICLKGAHQLLYEVIYNSIDEALSGECSEIEITIGSDRCIVKDNGRGIPTGIHKKENRSALEVVMTKLHSGGKFRNNSYKQTAGLHGVGLSCVNALSRFVEVTIYREGKIFKQNFKKGVPDAPLKEIGDSQKRGTKIAFFPDQEIFATFKQFDKEILRERVIELAFLHNGLKIILVDEVKGKKKSYKFNSGIAGFLKHLNEFEHVLLQAPFLIKFKEDNLSFQAAIEWRASFDTKIRSFVNCVNTVHGGTHVSAFRNGLTRAINEIVIQNGNISRKDSIKIESNEVVEGISAVINLLLDTPRFEGQTKTRLSNIEIIDKIKEETYKQSKNIFKNNPQLTSIIISKILESRSARIAARQAHEKIYYQNIEKNINEGVFKKQFGERSKNWHKSATWITHDELLSCHAELCDEDKDAVMLDVCCGSGVVGNAFRGKVKRVVGLDLTPEMVKLASTRLDEVHQGNIYQLPFADNQFDKVCTREVLHLLPYPERPISEIYRVLKPGGQFIVGQILPFSEDDGPWMYRVFKKKQPLICNMFQEEDFRQMLHNGGFIDVKMTEMNVWESIDVWINTHETTSLCRHEIRELFYNAPKEAKSVHPFKILPNGEIMDLWRWCLFSVKKPTNL